MENHKNFDVEESLKKIDYNLRYRLKDTLIFVGDFTLFNSKIIIREIEKKFHLTILFINLQLGRTLTNCENIEQLESGEKVDFTDYEYELYVKRYFSKLFQYYCTASTKLYIFWVGEENFGCKKISDICSSSQVPFAIIENNAQVMEAVEKEYKESCFKQNTLCNDNKRMKIAIIGRMGKYYSGGRYHAWMWAESLAYMGSEVFFITNDEPIYTQDTCKDKMDNRLHLIIESNFENDIDGITELDYVVMIPHRGTKPEFFYQVRNYSLKTNAKLVLLNFESPNWMNSYLQDKLDVELWEQWLSACQNGCMILSTDNESTKYAKEYYVNNPQYTIFRNCYLAINTFVADKIELKEKENRIISFVRFGDKHKGSYDILKVIDASMHGYTFVFVIGANTRDEVYQAYVEELEKLKEKFGINYEIKTKISDEEKYMELSRAKYLLFPSYFEGYGIPPVEAMYFNTKCLAYDLPVIHEVCGDGVIYCEYGNPIDMRNKLSQLICEDTLELNLREKIYHVANFENGARNLHKIFAEGMNIEWRDPKAEYLMEKQ